MFGSLQYLEDIVQGLPGQLVVNDGEEFAERPQEGRRLHTLSQQVLQRCQNVDCYLLKQTHNKVINMQQEDLELIAQDANIYVF